MKRLLPKQIQAGVTFTTDVANLANYPATDWTLNAYLRGPAVLNLAATADGAGFVFNKAPTDTGGWLPGVYSYVLRVTSLADATQVVQVEAGEVEVLADLAALSAATDLRTDAQKTLEAIEAVISKRATRDQERYKINERELWRTPIQELLRLRNTYRVEVRRERAKAHGMSLWTPAVRVVL